MEHLYDHHFLAQTTHPELKRVKKHKSIISTNKWDLGLFNVSPAHISVKSGVVPHFSNQQPIADADVRDLAKDMIDEL